MRGKKSLLPSEHPSEFLPQNYCAFFSPQKCYFSVITIPQGEVPPPVTSQATLLKGIHLISLFKNLNILENTKFSEIDI